MKIKKSKKAAKQYIVETTRTFSFPTLREARLCAERIGGTIRDNSNRPVAEINARVRGNVVYITVRGAEALTLIRELKHFAKHTSGDVVFVGLTISEAVASLEVQFKQKRDAVRFAKIIHGSVYRVAKKAA